MEEGEEGFFVQERSGGDGEGGDADQAGGEGFYARVPAHCPGPGTRGDGGDDEV